MNERGIIPIALALIVSAAILISGFMIAYKPEIHCSVGKNQQIQIQANTSEVAKK